MTRTLLFLALLLAAPVAAAAQTPVVNPPSFSWQNVTTNQDGTPLTDFKEYRLEVAPVVNGVVGTYAQRAVVTSPTPTPTAGRTSILRSQLGTLTDGGYSIRVLAADLVGNTAGASVPVPFSLNLAPPAVVTGLVADPPVSP